MEIDKKSIVIYCLFFCFSFTLGAFAGHSLFPKTIIQTPDPVIVTKTVATTEVQYVEKESPKDADVEITNKNPTVSVNGKKFEMTKLPDETNKFDKGKVTVEQGYSVDIKLKDIVPVTPKWGADIGYTNHGYKVGASYSFNRNVSMYAEAVPMPIEGKDVYYGVGLQIKF